MSTLVQLIFWAVVIVLASRLVLAIGAGLLDGSESRPARREKSQRSARNERREPKKKPHSERPRARSSERNSEQRERKPNRASTPSGKGSQRSTSGSGLRWPRFVLGGSDSNHSGSSNGGASSAPETRQPREHRSNKRKEPEVSKNQKQPSQQKNKAGGLGVGRLFFRSKKKDNGAEATAKGDEKRTKAKGKNKQKAGKGESVNDGSTENQTRRRGFRPLRFAVRVAWGVSFGLAGRVVKRAFFQRRENNRRREMSIPDATKKTGSRNTRAFRGAMGFIRKSSTQDVARVRLLDLTDQQLGELKAQPGVEVSTQEMLGPQGKAKNVWVIIRKVPTTNVGQTNGTQPGTPTANWSFETIRNTMLNEQTPVGYEITVEEAQLQRGDVWRLRRLRYIQVRVLQASGQTDHPRMKRIVRIVVVRKSRTTRNRGASNNGTVQNSAAATAPRRMSLQDIQSRLTDDSVPDGTEIAVIPRRSVSRDQYVRLRQLPNAHVETVQRPGRRRGQYVECVVITKRTQQARNGRTRSGRSVNPQQRGQQQRQTA